VVVKVKILPAFTLRNLIRTPPLKTPLNLLPVSLKTLPSPKLTTQILVRLQRGLQRSIPNLRALLLVPPLKFPKTPTSPNLADLAVLPAPRLLKA
jgi:hypothetical protein